MSLNQSGAALTQNRDECITYFIQEKTLSHISKHLNEDNFDIIEFQMFQKNSYFCIVSFIQAMCCSERKVYTPGLALSPQPMPKEVIPTCTLLHIRGPPESPCREIDENTGMYSNPLLAYRI